MRIHLAACLAVSSGLFLAAACGDDAGSGDAECHCNFGDVCTEQSDDCSTRVCSADGRDVKADGACDRTGALARCVCNDPNDQYVEYYYEGDLENLRERCEFFCDSPSFEPL